MFERDDAVEARASRRAKYARLAVAAKAPSKVARLEALYLANPCQETARALLRQRAVDRQNSLDHDRELAERYKLDF
jgi:hypothetical protein